MQEALGILNQEQQTRLLANELDVDGQLYDGFFSKPDQTLMRAVRAAEPSEVQDFKEQFEDSRLQALLPLYKARNYPKQLTQDEQMQREDYRYKALTSGGKHSRLPQVLNRLEELANSKRLTENQRYLLEELRLYGESIMPDPDLQADSIQLLL